MSAKKNPRLTEIAKRLAAESVFVESNVRKHVIRSAYKTPAAGPGLPPETVPSVSLKFDRITGLCELNPNIPEDAATLEHLYAYLKEAETNPRIATRITAAGLNIVDPGRPTRPYQGWDDLPAEVLEPIVTSLNLDVDVCLTYEERADEPRLEVIEMLDRLKKGTGPAKTNPLSSKN